MTAILIVLVSHGILGGFDVIWNHEMLARLPSRPDARTEQILHAIREAIFGLLFFSLAWAEWHGVTITWLIALIFVEILVSVFDTVIEIETRILPVTERVVHAVMYLNMGVLIALLSAELTRWFQLPSVIWPVEYGAMSWLLTAFAIVSSIWCLRDLSSIFPKRTH